MVVRHPWISPEDERPENMQHRLCIFSTSIDWFCLAAEPIKSSKGGINYA